MTWFYRKSMHKLFLPLHFSDHMPVAFRACDLIKKLIQNVKVCFRPNLCQRINILYFNMNICFMLHISLGGLIQDKRLGVLVRVDTMVRRKGIKKM